MLILVKMLLIIFLLCVVDMLFKIKILLIVFVRICLFYFLNNYFNIVIFYICCDKFVKFNLKYMLKYFKVVGNLLFLNVNNFCGILYYIYNSIVIFFVGLFIMIKFLLRDNIKFLL